MKLSLTLNISLAEAIERGLAEVSLDGTGPDGESEYTIEDVTVLGDADLYVEVEVEVAHVTGKFASKDDLVGVFADNLDTLDTVSVSL